MELAHGRNCGFDSDFSLHFGAWRRVSAPVWGQGSLVQIRAPTEAGGVDGPPRQPRTRNGNESPVILLTTTSLSGAWHSRGGGALSARASSCAAHRYEAPLSRPHAERRCAWTDRAGVHAVAGTTPTVRNGCAAPGPRNRLCGSGINKGYNLGRMSLSGQWRAPWRRCGMSGDSRSARAEEPPRFFAHPPILGSLDGEAIGRGRAAFLGFPPERERATGRNGWRVTFMGRRVYRDQVDVDRTERPVHYGLAVPRESDGSTGLDCAPSARGGVGHPARSGPDPHASSRRAPRLERRKFRAPGRGSR